MVASNVLNIIGLSLNIIGVIILFFYGIPPKIDTGGYHVITTCEKDKKELKEISLYKIISSIGIILIFLGFVMQLLSYFVKQ